MSETGYDRDFYAWTLVQAEALRAKDWHTLDIEHLAEEIEDLGKSDHRCPGKRLLVADTSDAIDQGLRITS